MATSSKPSHDVFGLGLGFLSWIFPDVSIGIKIAVSVIIIGLILFLRMSKANRDQTLTIATSFSETALTNFIVPAIGGGFRGLFIALIGVFIMDNFLNIRLVNHENDLSFNMGPGLYGLVSLFLHTLGNLNSTGSAIVIITVIIAAFSKIKDAETQRNEIILNWWTTEYTFATLIKVSRVLWMVSMKFDFSYNEKTYHHKEYDLKKRTYPGRTLYRIKFSPINPKIAKIIWDDPLPPVITPPPFTDDPTKSPGKTI
jgi:hypothetical protein